MHAPLACRETERQRDMEAEGDGEEKQLGTRKRSAEPFFLFSPSLFLAIHHRHLEKTGFRTKKDEEGEFRESA